jgi:succinyl-CoA synthetase alpha subunit
MRGKPVLGFMSGVLAGTANSMSKILSTVSNSVSNLSMDY